MTARTDVARHFMWRTMQGYWDGDGLIRLGGGNISRNQIENTYRDQPEVLVDRILSLMGVTASTESKNALYDYARNSEWWERNELVGLALMMPEMNVA